MMVTIGSSYLQRERSVHVPGVRCARPLLPNVGCPDANRTVSDEKPLETAWASLLATTHFVGGDGGTRTRDILLANQGLGNPLTSGFATSAGHGHDSGADQRRHDGL
jgi:hypothetical protein